MRNLSRALREDVAVRFARVRERGPGYATTVAAAVVDLIDQLAEARHLARF